MPPYCCFASSVCQGHPRKVHEPIQDQDRPWLPTRLQDTITNGAKSEETSACLAKRGSQSRGTGLSDGFAHSRCLFRLECRKKLAVQFYKKSLGIKNTAKFIYWYFLPAAKVCTPAAGFVNQHQLVCSAAVLVGRLVPYQWWWAGLTSDFLSLSFGTD